MKFDKRALTVAEQIALLKRRGMRFEDEAKAAHYLSNISYYRLSAYWYTLLEDPKPSHTFKAGTTFRTAVDTYVFDRKLRLLVFDEIERIEIALRTQLIYHFCHHHGNNWWEDVTMFRQPFHHQKFNELMQNAVSDSNETFIKHYLQKYSDPPMPPGWMTLELASFGQMSILYKNLRNVQARKDVAAHFRIHERVLESWLETLSFVRNTCAHHARLWNRKLPKPPVVPTNAANDWLKELPAEPYCNRMYLTLSIIAYLLKSVVPHGHFNVRIKELLAEFPNIPAAYMGFPPSWKDEELWR